LCVGKLKSQVTFNNEGSAANTFQVCVQFAIVAILAWWHNKQKPVIL